MGGEKKSYGVDANAERFVELREKGTRRSNSVSAKKVEVDRDFALRLLDEALEVANRIGDEGHRSVALSDIASAFAEAGEIERAKEIFEKALDVAKRIKNEALRLAALREIALDLAEAGEIERAKEIFEKALDVANRIKNEFSRLAALGFIASALAEAGEIEGAKEIIEKALDVANRIEEKLWRSEALGFIASALAEAGEIERAKEIIEKALDVANRIEDEGDRSEALREIALALAEAGEIEKALDVANRIEDEFRRSVALREIALALAEAGEFEKALDVAKRIKNEFWRSVALSDIASALAKAGEIERAKEILEKALDVAKRIEDEGDRSEALRRIASAILESYKAEKVPRLELNVEELSKKFKIPDELRSLLERARAGEAVNFEELRKKIEEIKGSKPSIKVEVETLRLTENTWTKLPVTVRNLSYAHAFNVELELSGDFEFKKPKTTNVEGLGSAKLEVLVKPKSPGSVPVEIKVKYEDADGKKFEEVLELLLEVSEVRGKQVQEFAPKPTTPKTFPPELSEYYTEVEYIGSGGFARVFKAKKRNGEVVAVKVPLSLDSATGKSFVRELMNWTKLEHPNIVKVYDYNVLPIPYIEMELCDCSLADLEKPMSPERAAWIIFYVAEGLKYAHKRGIIHRDLKPQNIMLKDGVPKITDWGLSKVVSQSSSAVSGFTPLYAAPEQVSGDSKDERTDIWQLGVVFYELVTGELPFRGEGVAEVISAILNKNPVPPSQLNPKAIGVEKIIMKCLEKRKEDRYRSLEELQKDLADYLGVKYSTLKSSDRRDLRRSAYYCGELLLLYIKLNDVEKAYRYASDFVNYAEGEVKQIAKELCEQLRVRLELGVNELPEELLKKAEVVAHKVRLGFREL